VRQGVFRRIAKELVEDLNERGKIDIREAFIDGSFAPTKKGVLLSARQSAAKAPGSWQSQTLLVFLSPLTLKALLGMRLISWLVTRRTTATNLTISFSMSAVLRWSHRTVADGKNRELKTAEN
jgi:hypothetical protein